MNNYESHEVEDRRLFSEIERKFLLEALPGQVPLSTFTVEQSYISIQPEVRIRQVKTEAKNSFWLTFKGEGTLVRPELNIQITRPQFVLLTSWVQGAFLKKKCTSYVLEEGETAVCCFVEGTDEDFSYVEVEFSSEKHAREFVPPTWFGKEITHDPCYKMKNFWVRWQNRLGE